MAGGRPPHARYKRAWGGAQWVHLPKIVHTYKEMEGRRISLAMTLSISLLLLVCACHAQLTTNYYQHSCPSALSSIRKEVKKAVKSEPRMAASLIRLHFHDCFVQGCEGSLLLDNSSKIDSEKNALPNLNSVRGFELIDTIKARLERECPAIVSCADILAVAARDASKYAKGPTWNVKVGRRDGTTASSAVAAVNLPAFTDSLQKLTELFDSKGLNKRDLVALSGAHTIGRARCVTFRDRIYNASSDLIDPGFASNLQRNCPRTSPDGNLNLANLDLVTPDTFDNSYFKILLQKKGLLASDQVLFSGDATFDAIVKDYSKNTKNFFRDFGEAMIKMGDNGVLTGRAGQIRLNCRVPN